MDFLLKIGAKRPPEIVCNIFIMVRLDLYIDLQNLQNIFLIFVYKSNGDLYLIIITCEGML
jgi:hypothetical protein